MLNMKRIITVIVLALLGLSIGLNVFFIAGKGIQIHNTYNQQQYQNQQQSQLLISMFAIKGKIKWEYVSENDIINKMNLKNIQEFLNTLSPEQGLFAKVYMHGLFYPVIEE